MLQQFPKPHDPQYPKDDAKRLVAAQLEMRRRATLILAYRLLLAALFLIALEWLFR